jgi:hypothetical protein
VTNPVQPTLTPTSNMTRLPSLVLAAAMLAVPLAASAQSSALVGSWAVEMTAGMRIENDQPTPIRAKAKLGITLVGDSLIATLDVEPTPDLQPRPQSRFAAAKSTANTVTFVQRSQATLNMNGEERQATVVSTWSLTADGDAITGTVARTIEGIDGPGMPTQPVSGTRIK